VTVTARSKAPDLPTFERHWQDEADAAFVYRVLADVEANEVKKDLYLRRRPSRSATSPSGPTSWRNMGA